MFNVYGRGGSDCFGWLVEGASESVRANAFPQTVERRTSASSIAALADCGIGCERRNKPLSKGVGPRPTERRARGTKYCETCAAPMTSKATDPNCRRCRTRRVQEGENSATPRVDHGEKRAPVARAAMVARDVAVEGAVDEESPLLAALMAEALR